MEEMMDLATKVDGLDGLELVSNWHVNDENILRVGKMLAERNLKVCMIVPDLWTQAKWRMGSIAAPDAKTRKEAVKEIKKSMDWAYALKCPYVDVWPGQDGYDYPFQADFQNAWKWMRDGIAECSEHNRKVKLLLEYKIKEPRTHCFLNSAAKTVLLLDGIRNAGCLLDVGHSAAAGENMAEAASFLSMYGMLDYIHLNDNFRQWDDDLIFSSVHVVESLELIYWLKKVRYEGWLTLDIFPYREDKLGAARNSFEWVRFLFGCVEKLGMEEIGRVVKSADACEATRMVRRMLGGK
jgi:xylose isomerase